MHIGLQRKFAPLILPSVSVKVDKVIVQETTNEQCLCFSPNSDQFQISLSASQGYVTQYEELGFSSLTQTNDDYATNSHYLTYTFRLKGWWSVLFELGSESVELIVNLVALLIDWLCIRFSSRASHGGGGEGGGGGGGWR